MSKMHLLAQTDETLHPLSMIDALENFALSQPLPPSLSFSQAKANVAPGLNALQLYAEINGTYRNFVCHLFNRVKLLQDENCEGKMQ